ncbi:Transposon TX1 uncharacterized protein [Nymphaea thermarum]|nr:Transposon TX1 uncharacterized protein [Nymphaea thermarum]
MELSFKGLRQFTMQEIWQVIRAIKDIVKHEVCAAVMDSFKTGKLERKIHRTHLVLVPEKQDAVSITEFRPIAQCNVIYKTISKIMVNRMKGVVGRIVNADQGAFIPRRVIQDQLLLVHELMHSLERSHSPPVVLKLDVTKAYDKHYASFKEWIKKIRICVSSVSFALVLNRREGRFFDGSRGLRQGAPMSPLLYIMIVELLSKKLGWERDHKQVILPRFIGTKLLNP